MSILNWLFGFNPVRTAEKIEAMCAETTMPCENIRHVAVAIRKGILTHPRVISDAIRQATDSDIAEAKRRGLLNA